MRISLACWDYDGTRALADGRVRPDGLEIDYLPLSPEETFYRMVRFREFDVSELSLSTYVLSQQDPEPPFVAIPVFPSRSFRHSGIYVRRDGPIRSPADLRGGRVGVGEYQLTANVWIRGILDEHFAVPADSVTYVAGGLEDPRRIEKRRVELPERIRVEAAPAAASLSELLARGELDAVYSPRAPSAVADGRVARLFEDYPKRERAYFDETRIFPIMHVIAIRADVYREHRWIAQSLVKAFTAARDLALSDLFELTAAKISLPWVPAQAEESVALMGADFWSYGVEPNRHVLETFLRYSAEQGLARPEQTGDGLFARETLETFAV